MKKLFTFLLSFSLISFSASAQTLDTLDYVRTQNVQIAKDLKNNSVVKTYKTKAGNFLTTGDTLKVGKASGGESMKTTPGLFIATRQLSKTYEYIYAGGMLVAQPLDQSGENEILQITEIKTFRRGSKNSPLSIYITTDCLTCRKGLGTQKRRIVDFEEAVNRGEVVDPHQPMNRQEAIAKLKEAKDLLDLGIMKQENYDSLKVKLASIITQ